MQSTDKQPIHIVHFNDVYEVRENEKSHVCGGADRFKTLVDQFQDKNPLVLFSGDLWNPSKLSAIYKGEHIVEVVNKIGIDAAGLGNHDLVSIRISMC